MRLTSTTLCAALLIWAAARAAAAAEPEEADTNVGSVSGSLIWGRLFDASPGALRGLDLLNPCARRSPTTGALELLPGARARMRFAFSVVQAMSHGFKWHVGAVPGAAVDRTPWRRVAFELSVLKPGAEPSSRPTAPCRPACLVVSGDHSLVVLNKTAAGRYDPDSTYDCACGGTCGQDLFPRERGTSFSMGSALNVSYGPWATHTSTWSDRMETLFPGILSRLSSTQKGSTLLLDIVADGICSNDTSNEALPLMRVSGMEIRKTCAVDNCSICDHNLCFQCQKFFFLGGGGNIWFRPVDSDTPLNNCKQHGQLADCRAYRGDVEDEDCPSNLCKGCPREATCSDPSYICSTSCWSSPSAAACALSPECRWRGDDPRKCAGDCAWCPGEQKCRFSRLACADRQACAGLPREQCQTIGCAWCALTSSCSLSSANITAIDTLCSERVLEAGPDPLSVFSGHPNVVPDSPLGLLRVLMFNGLAQTNASGIVFRPGGRASFVVSREAVERLSRGFAVVATLVFEGGRSRVRHTISAHSLSANGTVSECAPFCLAVMSDRMQLVSGTQSRAYRWPLLDAVPRAVTVAVSVGFEAVRVSVNNSVSGWFFTLHTAAALPTVASAHRLVVSMVGYSGAGTIASGISVMKTCMVSHCTVCDSEGMCQRCVEGFDAIVSRSSQDKFQRWCRPRRCSDCIECPAHSTRETCAAEPTGCQWCSLEASCKFADDKCAPDCSQALYQVDCVHPNCTWRAVTPTAGVCVTKTFTRDCTKLSATSGDCTPAGGCLACADGVCRDNQTECERSQHCDAKTGRDSCERGRCEWCEAVGKCVYRNGAGVACAGAQQEVEWSNATGSRDNFFWKPFKAAYPFALSGVSTRNATFSRVLEFGDTELGVAPGGGVRLAIGESMTRAMRKGFYALLRATLPDMDDTVVTWTFRALLANGSSVECAPLCLRMGARVNTEVRSGGVGRTVGMPVTGAGLWRKTELHVSGGVISLETPHCKLRVSVDPAFGAGFNIPAETHSVEVEFSHSPVEATSTTAAVPPLLWLSEFYVEPTCQKLHCTACNSSGTCVACSAGYELVGDVCLPPFNCSSPGNANTTACRSCPEHSTVDGCSADSNCTWCPFLAATGRRGCQWREDYCPPNCPAVCSGSAECRDLCLHTPRCYWRNDTSGGRCVFMDMAAPCPAFSPTQCIACAAFDYSCGGTACGSYGPERAEQCEEDSGCTWCDATTRCTNDTACEAVSRKLSCQWCDEPPQCVAAGECTAHTGDSPSKRVIAGVVVGVVAFVAVVVVIVAAVVRRNRRPANSNVPSSVASGATSSAALPIPLLPIPVVSGGEATAAAVRIEVEPERVQFQEYDGQGGLAVDEFSEATFVIRNLSDAVVTCSVRAVLTAEAERVVEVAVDSPLGRFVMNPGLSERARVAVLPKCRLSETMSGVEVVVWEEVEGEYSEAQRVAVPLDVVTRPSCKLDPRELVVLGKTDGAECGSTGGVVRGTWRGTEVAVKEMPAGWYTPQQVARELGALARLACPQVVKIHGAVPLGDTSAVVMEVAPLGSLADVLGTRELSEREQVLVAVDCARALDAAHRAGLLHGFVKAGNVLVFSLDEQGGDSASSGEAAVHAKVSDFGMERALATTMEGALAVQAMGTLQYMAPEVITARAFGPKADVYSFGLILWALATSREPFEGESEASIEKMRPAMDVVLQCLTGLIDQVPRNSNCS
eukprot:m51a1_g6170 putative protein serine threonine (1714) ;mRNA; f:718-6755